MVQHYNASEIELTVPVSVLLSHATRFRSLNRHRLLSSPIPVKTDSIHSNLTGRCDPSYRIGSSKASGLKRRVSAGRKLRNRNSRGDKPTRFSCDLSVFRIQAIFPSRLMLDLPRMHWFLSDTFEQIVRKMHRKRNCDLRREGNNLQNVCVGISMYVCSLRQWFRFYSVWSTENRWNQ